LFTDLNLFRLVVSQMATLSLEHGNSDGSCLAYAWLGGVMGTYFGEYDAGFRFGMLGLELVEKRGLDRFRARVYLVFAVHVAHWTQPLQTSLAFLRRAFEAALEAGDLSYAAYSCIDVITNRIATGDSLSDVEREAEHGLEFARKIGFGLVCDCITGQLRLIRMLRGQTPDFASFNDAEFDEHRFEQHLESNPRLAIGASYYWIRRLQASIYGSDETSAMAALWGIRLGGALRFERCRAATSAPGGAGEPSQAARGLGRELSRNFREPRGIGRRRDCTARRPGPGRDTPL
jgi:predicted ATPase